MQADDVPAASRLVGRVLRHTPLYAPEAKQALAVTLSEIELAKAVEIWPEAVILAKRRGEVVALSIASVMAKALELHWVMVDPEQRRARLGPTLYDTIMRQARYYGCHKVWGMSLTTNAGVPRHVVRQGGRVVGTLHKHAFGQDYVLWEHLLD